MVTPTARAQALRLGDFPTLWEALSYAAASGTGVNFFDGRGQLSASLSWGEIAEQAEALAGAFAALALPRGSRVGIVAETHPQDLPFLVSMSTIWISLLVMLPF